MESKKNDTNELMYKTETDPQTQKTNLWLSKGKEGGINWEFYIYIHCCVFSHSGQSDFFRPSGLQPAKLLCPWDSPVKNTGVGCHALFKGIFPTQKSNQGLLHCRWILYQLSYQGSPYIHTAAAAAKSLQSCPIV